MNPTAVVSGVGPGLGAALARKFAQEGCRVGLLARSSKFIQSLADELNQSGQPALAVPTDITDAKQVEHAFDEIRKQLGPVDILINHAGSATWNEFLDLSPEDLQRSWEICTLGAFLCSRQAVPDMLKQGGGAILFTGATSAIRGRAGALAFSSAKFAARGLADSMARELWAKNIHVAHIIMDGVIKTEAALKQFPEAAEGPLLEPKSIADAYWGLTQQDRGAWTFEIDLRPHNEQFFT